MLLVIPALILVVPRSGTTGAAAVWAGLNAGYVIFGAPLSFRKLMPTEMGRWYLRDTAIPLASALGACLAVRAAATIAPSTRSVDVILLLAAGVTTLLSPPRPSSARRPSPCSAVPCRDGAAPDAPFALE
jgi:hypothetical protein